MAVLPCFAHQCYPSSALRALQPNEGSSIEHLLPCQPAVLLPGINIESNTTGMEPSTGSFHLGTMLSFLTIIKEP